MPPPLTKGLKWLMAEDQAMKAYLQGMTVNDQTAAPEGRPVQVWFRMPEQEARERTYPYVTIDLVDIVEANDRMMNNKVKVSQMKYSPPEPIPIEEVAGRTNVADRPMPVDLYYQITAVTRSAIHDRQLQGAMMRKFPGKWGALYVPNDETARTMQLQSFASAVDVDEYGKRIFRRIYTVTVVSELWPSVIRNVQNLESLNITVNNVFDPLSVLSHLNCYSDD